MVKKDDMSSVLKNKMYNYEVVPPATLWEQVAVYLDEINTQKNIAKIIYNQETIVPDGAWNKITNALDVELQEIKFRSDVLDMEVQPPSFIWNKITEQLDTDQQEFFSTKLYEYEVAPPATSWDNIATTLDKTKTLAPVFSIRKRYPLLFRIAAAVMIIGIITWAGFRFFNDIKSTSYNNVANNGTKTIVSPPPVTETNPTTAEKTKEATPVLAELKDEIAPEKTITTRSKKWTTSLPKRQEPLVFTIAESEKHSGADDFAIADTESLHIKNKPAIKNTDTETEARYLVYLTEEGNIVKLSKKLVDLKCIYTKDGNISQDALAKLDASQCNDQVKYWQEKMANSSLQSSSNPLELIEILK